MTKSWVKKELRKNLIEIVIVKVINYVKANKNYVLIGLSAFVIVGLFAGVIIREKVKGNREAARLFAFAQNDFSRFNYPAAIEKLKNIQNNFPSAHNMDHVLYLKGLSYYRQSNFEDARKTIDLAITNHPKSTIISHLRLSLASVYEELEKYPEALNQYREIQDANYLKGEALIGEAVLLEVQGRTDEAVKIYIRVQSHFVETYWGNFAKSRLTALVQVDEFSPRLNVP